MKELNNNGYGYIGFVLLKVPCTSVKGRVHVLSSMIKIVMYIGPLKT